jgi:hypothetical protein
MESQLYTLSKIFTERLFRIPDYQRGYAWTARQLNEFWSDILRLNEHQNHYTGVLTLEMVPDTTKALWQDDQWIIAAKGYEPLYVVDGQQRLTTTIVLIQAILESIPDGQKLNYTTVDEIRQKYIFDSKDGGFSRSYIFGYERDNPSYEFLKTKIFKEFSSSETSEETVYTNNLLNAKTFFMEKLEGLCFPQVEDLYRKVTQNLLFNIFTISREVDVCVAFETMNNRGKRLSNLELLKNRLIYLSLQLDAPEAEKAHLRKLINDCWKDIYHNLGKNKDIPLDDDAFLQSHYLLHFIEPMRETDDEDEGELVRHIIYKALRDQDSYRDLLNHIFVPRRVDGAKEGEGDVSLEKIHNYVRSLQASVRKWYHIFNPLMGFSQSEEDFWLDKLNRLAPRDRTLVLSVLLNIDSAQERLDIIQKLERAYFVSYLWQTYYRVNDFQYVPFINLAILLQKGEITPQKLSKAISDQTNQIISAKGFMEDVRKNFMSRGFYTWRGVRYFLYEYNLDLQKRSKTDRRKLDWFELNERRSDYHSVEHIYPQNARAKYWLDRFSNLTPRQRAALRHSLGNLLPLSMPKNSSLSNRPFPEKVSSESGVVGYRFGCYAENEVSKEAQWTQQAILRRGLALLKFMEKRWNLNFGSEQEKVKMLGLTFVDLPESINDGKAREK